MQRWIAPQQRSEYPACRFAVHPLQGNPWLESEMKIYRGKIKQIAEEITRDLIKQEAIEVDESAIPEVRLDIESVLRAYVDTDQRLTNEARALLEERHLDASNFSRLKRELAKREGFGLGEEAMDWITDQLIEVIFHTAHVDEVWVEDHDLRRFMRPVLTRYSALESEVDEEVRRRIKNLNEGSTAWDIKYQQVLEDVKRRQGLE